MIKLTIPVGCVAGQETKAAMVNCSYYPFDMAFVTFLIESRAFTMRIQL